MFQLSIRIEPDIADNYYNLACIYAKLNQPEKAINSLKKAVEKGYDDLDQIKTDNDLDGIRAHRHYRQLIERLSGMKGADTSES